MGDPDRIGAALLCWFGLLILGAGTGFAEMGLRGEVMGPWETWGGRLMFVVIPGGFIIGGLLLTISGLLELWRRK